jgi:hypothetical protein
VRQAGKRIATFTLVRRANSAELSEIRGPCNAQVPEKIVASVRRWLRAQPPLPLWEIVPKRPKALASDRESFIQSIIDQMGWP